MPAEGWVQRLPWSGQDWIGGRIEQLRPNKLPMQSFVREWEHFITRISSTTIKSSFYSLTGAGTTATPVIQEVSHAAINFTQFEMKFEHDVVHATTKTCRAFFVFFVLQIRPKPSPENMKTWKTEWTTRLLYKTTNQKARSKLIMHGRHKCIAENSDRNSQNWALHCSKYVFLVLLDLSTGYCVWPHVVMGK